MSLAAGTRLGSYEIVSLLGAGGMGEVYRARDLKLGRDVAIKILPDHFAGDAERVARFEREARTLASLNHPHIAQIYGLEQSGNALALVMELVDGDDLSQRIAQGPIPVDEALSIARQIVDALDAAHSQGIVHRDLKPANVKVKDDGTVKVLDFGLAKPVESAAASSGATITSPAISLPGVILGTAAYMAPEQAKGRPVDKRADIWAFGCVLYEMVTGRRPFAGEDVSETIASILRSEPDWSGVPAAVKPLLTKCLQKDPRNRLRDVGDAMFLLDPALPAAGPARLRLVSMAALLIGAALIGGLLAITLRQAPAGSPADGVRPLQFVVNPSDYGQHLLHRFGVRDLTLSPDGSEVVFLSTGGLSRRPLASLSIHRIPDTSNATGPFMSPDGRFAGYYATGEIRKVNLPDGPSATVAKVAGVFRGATWTSRNTIVFAVEGNSGLMEVSANDGGDSRAVTSAESSEVAHWFPVAITGTDTVLFTIVRGSLADADVAAVDLSNGNVTVLVRDASQAEYSDGHLLFMASNHLHAVPYDAARGVVTGERFAINAELGAGPRGVANFATASNGILVYEAQGRWASRELVWVDRSGRETPTGAPPRPYLFLSLAPDASRVALDVRDGDNDIWVWEFGRRVLSRLTSGPTPEQLPLWSRDGQSIVYSSMQADVPNLWRLRADGGGQPQQLTSGRTQKYADDFSPDGAHLLFRESSQSGDVTPRVLTLADSSVRDTALAQAHTRTINARVSPNGRWIAYQSNESGRNEVYVRPYPDTAGGRWQLSTEGGTQPYWARSGRELFYIALDGGLMSLAIQLTPTFVAARPTRLLTQVYHSDPVGRSYEPSPDGQRFLMIKPIPSALEDGLVFGALAVVQRWRMLVAPAR